MLARRRPLSSLVVVVVGIAVARSFESAQEKSSNNKKTTKNLLPCEEVGDNGRIIFALCSKSLSFCASFSSCGNVGGGGDGDGGRSCCSFDKDVVVAELLLLLLSINESGETFVGGDDFMRTRAFALLLMC